MCDVTGTLIVKGETKEHGSNGFRKREFVIKTDSQYPQEIPLELIQDKCDLLDSCTVGQDLKCSYNLNGRSWINPEGETKYFGSTQVWRIENLGQVNNHQQSPPPEQFEPASSISDEDPDDLPF